MYKKIIFDIDNTLIKWNKDESNSIKKALDEHSPSKEMRQVGLFAGEGLVIGLNRMGSKVYDAGYNMGSSAIESMSKAIEGISNVINSDMDSNPTIRPVMDLTDIQNGSKQIFGMMNNIDGYNINGSINSVNSTAKIIKSNQTSTNTSTDKLSNDSVNSSNTPKQPVILQTTLQNGRVVAEYLIDDIDELLGSKNKMIGRMVGA